jgi:cytochrome c oxidase assembly factor CtaG
VFPGLLHAGHAVTWSAWHFEPTVIAGAVVVAGLYIQSVFQSRPRPAAWRIACFSLGSLAIFLALVSPLDAAADRLLSMHMLQHVVLTTIGPPLVLLGLAPAQLSALLRPGLLNRLARALTNPVFAAALFIINMWFWHVPTIYQEALTNLTVHVVMHIAFLATGLIFWWPVVQPLPRLARIGEGARLLYLFVTGFPMALLALLLIASGSVVYGYYETPPHLWGISPLVDQQVAGVIMGALGEAAAFIAITFLFFRFLDREEQEAPPPVPEATDREPALRDRASVR